MRTPEPSPRELRWSFIAVLACALMLTATLCWGIVHRVNQSDDIVHIAASNADTVERLNDQIDILNTRLAEQAQAAEQQRTTLQRQNRALTHQLDALVKFLRAHGLSVPDTVARAGPETTSPKGHGPRGPKPRPKPPATPGPTATPTPTTPGVTDVLCGLVPVPLICP
jgi:Flp pilus assembly protein TadB